MRRCVSIILLFCASALAVSCGGKTIPRDDMIQVLREMMITDVLIESQDSLVKMASSSLVYDAVLKKMGYTVPDFENTLNYYINRPDRLRSMVKDLQEQLVEERTKVSLSVAQERLEEQQRNLLNGWLEDSLPNSLNVVQKTALLQLMTPDPASLPVWRMDRDSLYTTPKLRVAPVLDTIVVVDSVPKYLAPPKRLLPQITFKILK